MRTPGKWDSLLGAKGFTILSSGDVEIGTIKKLEDSLLVAAAPELLDVARLALGLVEMCEKDLEEEPGSARREKAILKLALSHFKDNIRKAIRKAHGDE